MSRKRIKQSERRKIKLEIEKQRVKKPEIKPMTEYGGFIDGKSFEISPDDEADYEFFKGLWEAIEHDVKGSA
jgi:hypothetical protein